LRDNFEFLSFKTTNSTYHHLLELQMESITDLTFTIKSAIDATFNSTLYSTEFEVVVFGCQDEYCTECLEFDLLKSRGKCSKCEEGFELIDNFECTFKSNKNLMKGL